MIAPFCRGAQLCALMDREQALPLPQYLVDKFDTVETVTQLKA